MYSITFYLPSFIILLTQSLIFLLSQLPHPHPQSTQRGPSASPPATPNTPERSTNTASAPTAANATRRSSSGSSSPPKGLLPERAPPTAVMKGLDGRAKGDLALGDPGAVAAALCVFMCGWVAVDLRKIKFASHNTGGGMYVCG